MKDKTSRPRSSKSGPTTETAELQTKLDCSLEKLGKCLCSFYTSVPGKKKSRSERIEKQEGRKKR